MFKLRGGLAVMVATVAGIVLLIIAVMDAQEAMGIKTVNREEVFSISGKAHFAERYDQRLYRPKKHVIVQLEEYPASFSICPKSPARSAASFEAAVDSFPAVHLLIPKSDMALLYTRSSIKVYELSPATGQPVFSFTDAVKRDGGERMALYVQAAICFLGGLVLLIFPKRYLTKESK